MFGLPDQSADSWQSELKDVLSVCDDHVSLYQLTLERGTHLFRQVHLGEVHVPGDDVTATMYQSARKILEKAGFLQYEVSNFARNVSFQNRGGVQHTQYTQHKWLSQHNINLEVKMKLLPIISLDLLETTLPASLTIKWFAALKEIHSTYLFEMKTWRKQ